MISDTWSEEGSVGLQLGDLELPVEAESKFTLSKTTARSISETLTIHIPPGQQESLGYPRNRCKIFTVQSRAPSLQLYSTT